MQTFCNYEAFQRLEKTLIAKAGEGNPEAREDVESLLKCVTACSRYVAAVIEDESTKSYVKHTAEGTGNAIFMSQQSDRARHFAHEAAIINVKMLNRMCAAYGVDKVFIGDEDKRFEIGGFCGELVSRIFADRKP